MRTLHNFWILGILVLSGFANFSGCSTAQIDENNPESLMRDAEEDIKNDHYLIALDKLRNIRNKFPYSKYSLEAQLRIADVYFAQESYPEAAASYEAFYDLHPKHEKTAYALYRAGKSYLNDMPGTVARDLGPAHKALEIDQAFISQYPDANEATEVRKDISDIKNALADKELYIANFYFKQSLYYSAKPRYEKIVESYSGTPAEQIALERLSEIEKSEKLKNDAGAKR
jgi:outer membrane protein assembly factor BamD